MSSQSSGRRRSNNIRQYSAEDQALNVISKEAEARLAAKRAARAEAREIRMKEIKKQEEESEGKQDRVHELANEHASSKGRQLSGSRSGSRRGSTESNDSDAKDVDFKKRALKMAEIRELEEKYKTAMMTSAQLDNEKQSLVYQVELLKDQLEEQDEGYTELQREYKEKSRDYEFMKRDLKNMEHELNILKQQLEIKDRLIQDSGFVILANDKGEPVLEKQSTSSTNGPLPVGAVLVSQETKEFLEKTEGVNLGTAIHGCSSNTSSCSSAAGHMAGQLVSSSSVDAPGLLKEQDCLDSATLVPALGGIAEPCRDRAVDEALHVISDDVSTNLNLPHVHGVVPECCPESGSSEDHSVVVDNNNLDVVSPPLELDKKESLKIPSVGVRRNRRSKGSSGDEESDEGDEFYDAVSTPSPFDKSADLIDGVLTCLEESKDKSEGSSVDPIVVVSGPVKEEGLLPHRASLIVEQATVTESSSDYVEESAVVSEGEQPRENNVNEAAKFDANKSNSDNVELAVEPEKNSDNVEQIAINESSSDKVEETSVTEILRSEIADNDSATESCKGVNEEKLSTVLSLGDNEQRDDSVQETRLEGSELTDVTQVNLPSDIVPEELGNTSKDANDNECSKQFSADSENNGQSNVENIECDDNKVNVSDVATINTQIPSEQLVQTVEQDQVPENDEIGVASPAIDQVCVINDQSSLDGGVKDEPSVDSGVKDEPSVDSGVKDEPSVDNGVKDEPSVDSDVKDEPSVDSDVKDEPSIDSDVKNEPSTDSDVKDESAIVSDVKDEPSIDSDPKNEPPIDSDVKDEPSVDSDVKDESAIVSDVKDEPSIDSDTKNEPSICSNVKDEASADNEVTGQIYTADNPDESSHKGVKEPEHDRLKDELSIDTKDKKLPDENDILDVSETSSKEHIADLQILSDNPICNQESAPALNEEGHETDTNQSEDNSKLLVRSSSLVGSEASDGVGLDDYDLDDIDEILEAGKVTELSLRDAPQSEAVSKEKDSEKVTTPSPVEIQKTSSAPAESQSKLAPELSLGAYSPKPTSKKADSSSSHKKEKSSKSKSSVKEGKKKKEDHAEGKGGSQGKLDKAESQTSLETADLEGVLDKQMSESGLSKTHKKSKKFDFFKKVFTK